MIHISINNEYKEVDSSHDEYEHHVEYVAYNSKTNSHTTLIDLNLAGCKELGLDHASILATLSHLFPPYMTT